MSLIQNLIKSSFKPAVEELEEQLQPVEGELEESVLEVVESQKELDDQAEATQRLETTAQSLEAFAIAIENKLSQNIPMSRAEARATRIGLEHMLIPCGITADEVAVGLEEFGEAPVPTEAQDEALQADPIGVATEVPVENELSETEAIQASQESLDNIKATLLRFWEAIKSAVAKVVEMVKGFFIKLFGTVKALEARAKALIAKKATLAKLEAGEGEITIPSNLAKSGAATKADITAAIKDLTDSVSNVAEGNLECAASYYGAVKKAMADVAAGKAADQAAVEVAGKYKKGNLGDTYGGFKFVASDRGGYEIATGAKVEAGKTAPLSATEIAAVGESVLKLAAAIKTKGDHVKAVQAEHDSVLKEAESLAKAAGKGAVGTAADNVKVRWAIKLSQKNYTAAVAKLCSIALRAGYSAVSVAEKSAKTYKEKAAK